jgi:hypothetical protein
MWNIAHDSHGPGFKAVHAVLAVISVGLGIAVGVIGWRALRTAPASGDESDGAGGSAAGDGHEALAAQQRPKA